MKLLIVYRLSIDELPLVFFRKEVMLIPVTRRVKGYIRSVGKYVTSSEKLLKPYNG